MAVQPEYTVPMDQFVRPFCIAIMYQNFATFAPANTQKFRLPGSSLLVAGTCPEFTRVSEPSKAFKCSMAIMGMILIRMEELLGTYPKRLSLF